ncbi:MAG: hypothetical protein LBN07_03620 [Christensenellaceae bacterium]|jgi:hypothetical protein|nr:hypothetical protein [Christensenellaceae bacterium]
MKKFHRIVAASSLVLVMGGALVAPPIGGLTEQFYQTRSYSVFTAPGVGDKTATGAIISVDTSMDPIPTQSKVGHIITLPKGTLADAGVVPNVFVVNPNVKPTIKDSSGRVIPYDSDTSNGFKFTPTSADRYTVVYSYDLNEGFGYVTPGANEYSTTSQTFIINVVGEEVTIEIPGNNPGDTNDNIILPINVLGGSVSGVVDVVIPNPIVKDANGDVIDFSTNPNAQGYGLRIEVINTQRLSSDNSSGVQLPDNGSGNYKFTPDAGTNIIRYAVLFNGAVISTLNKTVVGSTVYKKTFDIGFTVSGLATSASLKEKVRLPLASAFNKNDANATINVHTLITVQHRVDASTLSAPLPILKDDDGYYFIPEQNGEYKITYKVRDFYGNEAEVEPFSIENVRDTMAPKLFVVEDYSAELTADPTTIADTINRADAKWMVPTTYGLNMIQISFPAIYGEDTVVPFENLTFTRRITSTVAGFTEIDLQDAIYHSAGADTAQKRAAELATITIGPGGKITVAGDYTVTYRVSDGNGYSASWTFTFSIKDVLVDSVGPTVTYPVDLPTLIEDGKTYRFTKPTVTDNYDTNIRTQYYITLNGSGNIGDAIYFIGEDEDNSAMLSFKSDDLSLDSINTIYELATLPGNGDMITIVTKATDDYGNVTEQKKNISVKNTNDIVRPVVTVANGNDSAFDGVTGPGAANTYEQGAPLYVSGVTFFDNDPSLRIAVTVRDERGNVVTGYQTLGQIVRTEVAADVNGRKYQYQHPGISFTPNFAEKYTVTYTAVDVGNNFSSITYQIKQLTDTEPPTLSGVSSTVVEMELGTRKDLGNVTAHDNDVGGSPGDISDRIQITCVENASLVSGTIFTPENIGTYTIRYSVIDDAGYETTKDASIRVVDTRKPILELRTDGRDAMTDAIQIFFANVSDASLYGRISVPLFITYDQSDLPYELDGLRSTGEAKVVGPDRTYSLKEVDGSTMSGSELIALSKTNLIFDTNDTTANEYWFTPTRRGAYTVTYTAKDLNGNSADSKTIQITVGDTIPPVIEFVEGKEVKETITIGGTISINTLADFLITDNIDRASNDDDDTNPDPKLKVNTIALTDESGVRVEATQTGDNSEIYTWTLNKAGRYTLTVTSTDMAGNTATFSRSITVLVEGSTSGISNEVLGTILIVISLLILAGVIIYFIRGGKVKGQPAKAGVTSSGTGAKKTTVAKTKEAKADADVEENGPEIK